MFVFADSSPFVDFCSIFGAAVGFLGLGIGIWSLCVTIAVNKRADKIKKIIEDRTDEQRRKDQFDMIRGLLINSIDYAIKELNEKKTANQACTIVYQVKQLIGTDPLLLTVFDGAEKAEEYLNKYWKQKREKLVKILSGWKGALNLTYDQISKRNKCAAQETAQEVAIELTGK